ncbi:MAG: hypothetical protein LBE18_07415 [Planctomycetaceae bacterium]|nr:hypothetical protein [Planctomycetaceae bacterium]
MKTKQLFFVTIFTLLLTNLIYAQTTYTQSPQAQSPHAQSPQATTRLPSVTYTQAESVQPTQPVNESGLTLTPVSVIPPPPPPPPPPHVVHPTQPVNESYPIITNQNKSFNHNESAVQPISTNTHSFTANFQGPAASDLIPLTSKSLDKLREIYIPENELGRILESAKNSLLIKRDEFEKLLKESREIFLEIDRNNTRVKSPVEAVLLASDYKINVADLRAVIEGTLEIEILTDDVVAIPIQLDRISVIEIIDIETKKPAALEILQTNTSQQPVPQQLSNSKPVSNILHTNQNGRLILQGKKLHKIKLVATTPLEIDSTRQRLVFQLIHGAKNSMRLSIPGDVELKSGASVISRKVEEQSGGNNTKSLTTHFDLLADYNNRQTDITMSLNSHKIGAYQAVQARSIQFAEVTEQYEKLHATISLTEMHQGISQAEFDVPEGFEITDVVSILLDKWNVEKNDKNKIDGNKIDGNSKRDKLKLKFREQLPGLTTIYLSAIKVNQLSDIKSTEWQFPLFNPCGTASNSAVLGLFIEQELEMTNLVSDKLYPIDPINLRNVIPTSALKISPGAPLIRLATAWYAPRDQFTIKANFKRPKIDCKVETREFIVLDDKTPTIKIDYTITALAGKIFETIIEIPINWKIASITADKKLLEFDEVNSNKNGTKKQQIRIQFPHGIISGETFSFTIQAAGEVEGWFTNDGEKKIIYPQFNVINATNLQGKIGILYGGEVDCDIVPAADENLIPLDDSAKQNLLSTAAHQSTQNLTQVPANSMNLSPVAKMYKTVLAYEYFKKPFELELKLEKLKPRLNVKTTSIYSFTPTLLKVNYELWFTIKHASTQRLTFLLPIETPNIVSIKKYFNRNTQTGHDNNQQSNIKETFNSEIEIDGKKYRRWEIVLSKPQDGLLKLNVDFEMPIEQNKNNKENININTAQPFNLPRIFVENTAWQSDIIAIQGDEELDLQVLTELDSPTKSGEKISVLRSVDVGTIEGMNYQPDKRLIGVYSLIKDDSDVAVMMKRNKLLPLVTAVIENAAAVAQLGNSAESGTLYSINYNISTDSTAVMFEPVDTKDEIWSIELDGKMLKPQRVGNDILIPIQQQELQQPPPIQQTQLKENYNKRLRRIRLVYRNFNNPLRNIRLSFPSLRVKQSGTNIVIPVMQTQWSVIPPAGYNVTKIGDTIIYNKEEYNLAIFKIAGVCSRFFGVVNQNFVSSVERRYQFSDKYLDSQSLDTRREPQSNVENPHELYYDEKKSESSESDRAEQEQAVHQSYDPQAVKEDNNKIISSVPEPIPQNENSVSSVSGGKSVTSSQRIRRLKSAQPVTVVLTNLQGGMNYSRIGTKNIQSIAVKISNSSNHILWCWISYLSVLLAGLLLIKSNYIKQLKFVLTVIIVGTLLVFIPYIDVLTPIFNSSVYACLTVAIIFIVIAVYKKFAV